MMHKLDALRNELHASRNRFEGRTHLRPILTGTARGGMTPSDIEGLEAVTVRAQSDDGSMLTLTGYDDIDTYL